MFSFFFIKKPNFSTVANVFLMPAEIFERVGNTVPVHEGPNQLIPVPLHLAAHLLPLLSPWGQAAQLATVAVQHQVSQLRYLSST